MKLPDRRRGREVGDDFRVEDRTSGVDYEGESLGSWDGDIPFRATPELIF